MQNNGELPKYLVEDAHEAIIDRDTFQKVRELIAQKTVKIFSYRFKKPLSIIRNDTVRMLRKKLSAKSIQAKVLHGFVPHL